MDLISQLEEILLLDEYKALKRQTIQLENEELPDDEHILDFLLSTNRKEIHDQVVKNHIVIALLGDMCYFLQEAMSCSLKMRLPVCFALLRKPFVYSSVVILRLLFETGFLDRFNDEEDFDPSSISAADRLELIKGAIECMPFEAFRPEDINQWIFDKTYPDSIINLSEMALHLTTTRNKHIATEKQNFNFVFSGHEAILSQWELIYTRMPALLLFLAQVSDMLLISCMNISDDLYQKRLKKRIAIMRAYRP